MVDVSERARVGVTEGQVPGHAHGTARSDGRHEDVERSGAHVVAAHGARVGPIARDRHKELPTWSKEQRLAESTRLAHLIEVDLAEVGSRGAVELQHLVGVAGVGTEAGHIEVAVWAKRDSFGAVEIVAGVAIHEIAKELPGGGIPAHDLPAGRSNVADRGVEQTVGTDDHAARIKVYRESRGLEVSQKTARLAVEAVDSSHGNPKHILG